MNIPDYSNEQFWDNITQEYVHNKSNFVQWNNLESDIWKYFKYCLKKRNRYFFQHPIFPLLKAVFSKHLLILKEETKLYRARNDCDEKLENEWIEYLKIKRYYKYIQKIEKEQYDPIIIQKEKENYESLISSEHIQEIKMRIESGFQGFNAKDSSAPPSEKALAGRCNLKGVAYLYAALDEHTAVAEIRPHIKDTISVALLKPLKDLKLIDFDYEPTEYVFGENFFFNEIQREFAIINKTQNGNYLITQYITALIEHFGYDGICFKSSLAQDGTNIVIFKPENCPAISSKLYFLSDVSYKIDQF